MTHPSRLDIAAQVRAEIARWQAKIRQDDLASELEMSRNALSDRLSGEVEWRITELLRLGEILEVPITAFIPKPQPAPLHGAS